ncbi:MAG: hypothetical protein QOE99_1320, partial [Actinomycetota bacterium]|nr:hypothetical protein [Actinomycetota bacterium]
MTRLASCDVESLAQVAAVLGSCAELTAEGSAACVRAGSATWRWRGPAARSFDAVLGGLRRQLGEVESAHQEAAEAVGAYARALADAVASAQRADAMDCEAVELSASFRRASAAAVAPLCGPDPGEGLRAAAARLRAEAAGQEEIAASWAAAKLDGLAQRAPHAPQFAGSSRFLDDFVGAVGSSFVGLAQMGVLAGESLGIGGHAAGARHDLWASVKDSVKVWEPVQDIWHDLTGGRPGSAVGAAAGMALTRKPGLGRDARHRVRGIADDGTRFDYWRTGASADGLMRRSATQVGRRGVVLRNEEARGGHAIERHVGKTDAYLRSRNAEGVERASTFPDLATAQRLVNQVLRRNAHRLAEVYAAANGQLVLIGSFEEVTGRVAELGSAQLVTAHRVRVV